jgi:hypothetical protein
MAPGRKGSWPFREMAISTVGFNARYIQIGVFICCLEELSLSAI